MASSEWGDSKATARPLAPSSGSLPFWLPYSLIIVSSAPIYSLLMDILRISWARCHQDVATFALSMHNLLHFKLPLVGEKIQLPVSADLAHNNTRFVATIPGGFDFSLGASRDHDIPFWPLFRALDADNPAEVALSPLGRVLLISAHPVMLGIAAEAFRVILERQGWKGAVHPTVHARDLKLFVEDPGPWLIAIPSESRAIALTDISPEVAIVDLDQNSVIVRNTSPGALLSGSAREKARTRLANAINVSSSYFCVPPELQEAFPVGRFRPFSAVEVAGVPKEAERLRPPVNWDWDQDRALKEFDAILCEAPRTSLLSKVLRLKATRRAPVLSAETTHVQTIIRDHLKTFVDRRDLLESRINGLNTKLALLMSESLEWEKSLEIFKAFSEKLTRESMDLKTRLEKERRESRRLTTAVGRERQVQAQLEASLSATNSAREEALLQLANVEAVRSTLARQKNALETEIRTILSAGETGPLYEAVYSRIEALSARSDTSSRPGTSLSTRSLGGGFSRRRSSVIGGIDEMEEEEEDVYDERVTEMAYDGSRETVQMVVQEAISSIQSRLAIVLQSAEQMEGPGSRRSSTSSSILLAQTQERLDNTWSHVNADGSPIVAIPSQDFPDTPPQSSTFPTQVDEEVEELSEVPVTIKTHEPRRFRPKPFQLASPPTTPDVDSIPGAFVTTRSTRPRRRHRAQPSTSSDTFSFDDGNPPRGAISFDKSFFTPNGSYEYSVDPSFSRQSDTDADSFVSAEGYSSPNDSYHAQEKPSPSDDDDATEVNPSPVQPRSTSVASIRSWHEQRAESPFGSTSVEFFTRASSRAGSRAGSRNGRPMLFAEQPSKLPRPVSGISVSSTVKEIRKRFE
ncbi:hypothetical protein MNV49_002042 [Pseudohyphozyma bogoriensis]|nr:hypothetical protein MNV49_002042 [Pseudohyphozyma bogoriensis]